MLLSYTYLTPSYNHGQKSWDIVHLWLFKHVQKKLLVAYPSPHPTSYVEKTSLQYFLTFNILLGGGGGTWNRLLK